MAAIKPQSVVGAGVLALPANRSVADAAEALARPDVRALLIVNERDDGLRGIVGLLTERDVVRAVEARGESVYNCYVRLITEPDYPVIDADAPPGERLRLFCDRRTNYVVLRRDRAFGGVLSIWDCVEASAAQSDPASRGVATAPA